MATKRYELYFTSDKIDHKSNIGHNLHDGGKASNIKTIRSYMSRIKKEFAADNPRDFFYTDQEYERPLDVQNRVYLDPDRIVLYLEGNQWMARYEGGWLPYIYGLFGTNEMCVPFDATTPSKEVLRRLKKANPKTKYVLKEE